MKSDPPALLLMFSLFIWKLVCFMRAISLSSFALFHGVQYNCTDDSHVPGDAGARE